MKIGVMELIVIFIVALVVLGPDKLPEYAKKLGSALGEFRKATTTLTSDIREEVVAPLEEAQEPLQQAVEPLDDLRKGVAGEWEEVGASFLDLGKPRKAAKAAPAPARPEPAPAGDSAQTELSAGPAAAEPTQNP